MAPRCRTNDGDASKMYPWRLLQASVGLTRRSRLSPKARPLPSPRAPSASWLESKDEIERTEIVVILEGRIDVLGKVEELIG